MQVAPELARNRGVPMPVKRSMQMVLLLLLWFPMMGNSQTRDTALQGQILDSSGTSMAGARLLVINLDTFDEQRAVVKANGKFSFPQMAPGDYVVIAATPTDTPCFRPAVERVRLESNTTRTLRLVMIPSSNPCGAQ
jgi:Carboxypeptidase regulatory-like domain